MSSPVKTESTADREMVIERVVRAPRELVFAAWTDRAHIGNWWGPRGFRTTTTEMDVRPGGVWRFTMHGPDGTDYLNRIVYTAVERPERLAYDHFGEGDHDNIQFTSEILFTEISPNETRVTLRNIIPTAELCRELIEKYGAIEGGQQTLERMSEHVALSAENVLVLRREINAPRALVYTAWTEKAHLANWFCPKEFTLLRGEFDVQPGGRWQSHMRSPEGQEFISGGVYRDVIHPHRLVFTHRLESGSTDMGQDTVVAVQFQEVDGGTAIEIRQAPLAAGEQVHCRAEGWSATIDNLAGQLGSLQQSEIVRSIAAPISKVWAAWTRPEQAAKWYGARDHATPVCEMDVRSGGRFRLCMVSPTGQKCWEQGVYTEVLEGVRIASAYEVTLDDKPLGRLFSEVEFSGNGPRTEVKVRYYFRNPEFKEGTVQGTNEALDRLAAFLGTSM